MQIVQVFKIVFHGNLWNGNEIGLSERKTLW